MTAVLLTAHIIAVILALGPVAVAGSMFPVSARMLVADNTHEGARAVASTLHRICRVYAIVGISIPVFGVIVAIQWHKLAQPWLIVSIILTALAAALLAAGILPLQRQVLSGAAPARAPGRIGMLTGVFNLVWVVVTVLMVIQPGAPPPGGGG